jgi:phospholipid-transporting ATPase
MIVFDGANYKLLVKGADSSILPNLTKNFHHPYKVDIETYLTKFSLLGYRTLVFAEKYLTRLEFEDIQEKYNKAMNSGNRKKDVKALANQIEDDLILLGCTAVEDALQLRVKDAITRLLQADIKVWMITGDKLETAENIGLMAGIVTHDMETFYIDDVNKQNFMQVAKTLKEDMDSVIKDGKIRLNGQELKLAIVFDMRKVGKVKFLKGRLDFFES